MRVFISFLSPFSRPFSLRRTFFINKNDWNGHSQSVKHEKERKTHKQPFAHTNTNEKWNVIKNDMDDASTIHTNNMYNIIKIFLQNVYIASYPIISWWWDRTMKLVHLSLNINENNNNKIYISVVYLFHIIHIIYIRLFVSCTRTCTVVALDVFFFR